MSKSTKICRVCGKKYEACHTPKTNNAFRWQEVSCSPECGSEYLRRITLSRTRPTITDNTSSIENKIERNEDCNGFYDDDYEIEEEYATEFGA